MFLNKAYFPFYIKKRRCKLHNVLIATAVCELYYVISVQVVF
ncbi:hypothetical protein SS05631_a42880 (plasmid) [Sinorhizobium sp. CCBAU 05631]|nr:hypothetical protein SS05631_a42880 [Sinorhizobium sp. CCBAU 05631]ASY74154.1 hypothetical protein SF83666_a45670 [Sinorhizobium fredii CCBAU 83666]